MTPRKAAIEECSEGEGLDDISPTPSRADPDGDDSPELIVKRENSYIFLIRIIVVLLLLAAAAATGGIVYKVMSDAEDDAFEAQFDAIGTKIVESLVSDTALKFWMGRTLANSITLALEVSGLPVTNLTIPQKRWERATQEIKFVARSDMVSWSPFLNTDEERRAFEANVQKNDFFVGAEDPCYVCHGNPNQIFENPDTIFDIPGFGPYSCSIIERAGRRGIIPSENCEQNVLITEPYCKCIDIPEGAKVDSNILQVPKSVFSVQDKKAVDEEYGDAPYLPIYQVSIVQVEDIAVMYNQLSEKVRQDAINDMLISGVPVMSDMFIRQGDFYELYTGRSGEVSSILYYPVVDPKSKTIVASIAVELLWADFVTAVLPQDSDMVDVVVISSCGSKYTFRYVPASDSFTLRGPGDQHDPKFNEEMRSSNNARYEGMVEFLAPDGKKQADLQYCRYSFQVYATQELEDQNISRKPILYAMVTAVIFVFTSLVFITYDYMVRVRQAKIMAAAKRTNDIVASLFPSNVRTRLYERAVQGKGAPMGGTNKMIKMLGEEDEDDVNNNQVDQGAAIADHFPCATILFLDIAGFTKWSSTREPAQVFKLLETIYAAFDLSAKKLGVFKIETIGDCYVASAGLPKACDDHAIIMCRFAKICLKKVSKLSHDLAAELGESTRELKARVGLHSGPVTAGVLRGEKARFQVFGDTVNMASRMESTGQPGCIQASEQTAELLRTAGKMSWITPRETLVEAKGKGQLQTYWVNPPDRGTVETQTSTVTDTSEKSAPDIERRRESMDLPYHDEEGETVEDTVRRAASQLARSG